jgi:hypothetical protein
MGGLFRTEWKTTKDALKRTDAAPKGLAAFIEEGGIPTAIVRKPLHLSKFWSVLTENIDQLYRIEP